MITNRSKAALIMKTLRNYAYLIILLISFCGNNTAEINDDPAISESERNLAQANEFMKINAQKDGIVVTASGLQYRIVRMGTGDNPTIDDRVRTHYIGTLIDGSEFDNSYERNDIFEFNVDGGVIQGWTETIQLMKEGAKWQVFIHPDLAYGDKVRKTRGPNTLLIFEIELFEIVK